MVGLFLAFATRKVKVKGIGDAKEIAAIVYITSIVWAITLVANYTLNEYHNTYAAMFSIFHFIGTTVIMGFVFIPKVSYIIIIYKMVGKIIILSWLFKREFLYTLDHHNYG